MRNFSPSQASEHTGFSLDTLRYYERIGLLDGIARTSGGQRIFTEDHISWLGLIRCLRDTGMPIAIMLKFAALLRGGDETIAERITLLSEHERQVEEHINQLNAQRERIHGKIAWYRTVMNSADASHGG